MPRKKAVSQNDPTLPMRILLGAALAELSTDFDVTTKVMVNTSITLKALGYTDAKIAEEIKRFMDMATTETVQKLLEDTKKAVEKVRFSINESLDEAQTTA